MLDLVVDQHDLLDTRVTVAQAAVIARVTTRTVRRWIALGRLVADTDRRVAARDVLAVEAAGYVASRRGRPGPRDRAPAA